MLPWNRMRGFLLPCRWPSTSSGRWHSGSASQCSSAYPAQQLLGSSCSCAFKSRTTGPIRSWLCHPASCSCFPSSVPFTVASRLAWEAPIVREAEASGEIPEGSTADFFSSLGIYVGLLFITCIWLFLVEASTREAFLANLRAEKERGNVTDFLSFICHELRNPLNALNGNCDLLAEDEELSGDQREQVHDMQLSCRQMRSVLTDVLDMNKIASGAMSTESVAFNLDTLVTTCVHQFRGVAELKGLDVQVFIACDVPSLVIGDPSRIAQCLTNLVSNACKFVPAQSGRVYVFVNMQEVLSTSQVPIAASQPTSSEGTFKASAPKLSAFPGQRGTSPSWQDRKVSSDEAVSRPGSARGRGSRRRSLSELRTVSRSSRSVLKGADPGGEAMWPSPHARLSLRRYKTAGASGPESTASDEEEGGGWGWRRGNSATPRTVSVPAAVRILFRVIDNGPGLLPSEASRLFKSFQQARASVARQHGGSGLGLMIVRTLAENMGGGADLASVHGQGSTFWFNASLGVRVPSTDSVDTGGGSVLNYQAGAGKPAHFDFPMLDDSTPARPRAQEEGTSWPEFQEFLAGCERLKPWHDACTVPAPPQWEGDHPDSSWAPLCTGSDEPRLGSALIWRVHEVCKPRKLSSHLAVPSAADLAGDAAARVLSSISHDGDMITRSSSSSFIGIGHAPDQKGTSARVYTSRLPPLVPEVLPDATPPSASVVQLDDASSSSTASPHHAALKQASEVMLADLNMASRVVGLPGEGAASMPGLGAASGRRSSRSGRRLSQGRAESGTPALDEDGDAEDAGAMLRVLAPWHPATDWDMCMQQPGAALKALATLRHHISSFTTQARATDVVSTWMWGMGHPTVIGVADDDAAQRRMMVNFLRKQPHLSILKASDGISLLTQHFSSEPWRSGHLEAASCSTQASVLCFDINMSPGIGGMPSSRLLRLLEVAALSSFVPVVAVTANSDAADVEHYVAAGMSMVEAKPVDRHRLLLTVERLVRTRSFLIVTDDAEQAAGLEACLLEHGHTVPAVFTSAEALDQGLKRALCCAGAAFQAVHSLLHAESDSSSEAEREVSTLAELEVPAAIWQEVIKQDPILSSLAPFHHTSRGGFRPRLGDQGSLSSQASSAPPTLARSGSPAEGGRSSSTSSGGAPPCYAPAPCILDPELFSQLQRQKKAPLQPWGVHCVIVATWHPSGRTFAQQTVAAWRGVLPGAHVPILHFEHASLSAAPTEAHTSLGQGQEMTVTSWETPAPLHGAVWRGKPGDLLRLPISRGTLPPLGAPDSRHSPQAEASRAVQYGPWSSAAEQVLSMERPAAEAGVVRFSAINVSSR